ncbi:hypothetical protein BDW62DRAFT_213371 [Aspergillus aurantiobrunneus]
MVPLLLLAPFLAGQTIATQSVSLKRDHDTDKAFVPGTTPGCPEGWSSCGSSGICYNPDEGQACCPGGIYACPSSSFCLLDSFCCPSNLTPESCAREYGLILTTSHPSSPEQTQPPTGEDSSDQLNPRPTLPPTSASSITVSWTPISTSSIALWPSMSVTGFSSPSVEGEPAYTGAGSSLRGGGRGLASGVVAAVIGGLGWGI